MTSWDERFRAGEYPSEPEPSAVLERHVARTDGGRTLDVATGTGRNAVFLAGAGYDVDAIDQPREGLRIARENARERGVADRLNLSRPTSPPSRSPRAATTWSPSASTGSSTGSPT